MSVIVKSVIVKNADQFETSRSIPVAGVVLLVLCGAFPLRMSTGESSVSVFDLAVLFAALHLAVLFLSNRCQVPRDRPMLGVVIILAGLAALSTAWSQDPRATLFRSLSWLEAAIVVAYVSIVVRGRERLAARLCALFAVTLLIAPILMYAGIPEFQPPQSVDRDSGDYLSYFVRLSHPFIGRSNNLAALLAILVFPLAFWTGGSWRYRFVAVIAGCGLLLTLSRGSILGCVIGLLGWLVFGGHWARRRFFWFGMVLAGAVYAVGSWAWRNIPEISEHISGRWTTDGARLELLSTGWEQAYQGPLLGIGGGVGVDYHNAFLQPLVNYGIFLGGIAAVALAMVPLFFLRYSWIKDRLGKFSGAIAWGVSGVFISYHFEATLEGTLLAPLSFLALALVYEWMRAAGNTQRSALAGQMQPIGVGDKR